jgi:CheY-like chemotaxis protein
MKTVLVVDDEYDLLQTICASLELGGYHSVAAGDARAALEAIKTSRPDLILTDVMMPYMSGYELIDAMRKLPEGEKMPVVLMSAINPDQHPQGNWDAMLPKPFSLEALLGTIGSLLGEA